MKMNKKMFVSVSVLLIVGGLILLISTFAVMRDTSKPTAIPVYTVSKSGPTRYRTINDALAAGRTTITVGPGTYTENIIISSGSSVTIVGADKDTTIIDGGSSGSVIDIDSNAELDISGCTITNGYAEYGGGIRNDGIITIEDCYIMLNYAQYGGGVFSNQDSKITITDSVIANNCDDSNPYNPVDPEYGGGIFLYRCIANISRTEIVDNIADQYGGGICIYGADVTSTENKIYSNDATIGGGVFNCDDDEGDTYANNFVIYKCTIYSNYDDGIANCQGGVTTITNSTISESQADGVYNWGGTISISYATIYNNGGYGTRGTDIEVGHTIIANNTTGDCQYEPTSNGYNLFSDGTGSSDSTDISNTDPELRPLQTTLVIGGLSTPVYYPRSTSPVIDAGSVYCSTNEDQRGATRPYGGRGDIGAVEYTGELYTTFFRERL